MASVAGYSLGGVPSYNPSFNRGGGTNKWDVANEAVGLLGTLLKLNRASAMDRESTQLSATEAVIKHGGDIASQLLEANPDDPLAQKKLKEYYDVQSLYNQHKLRVQKGEASNKDILKDPAFNQRLKSLLSPEEEASAFETISQANVRSAKEVLGEKQQKKKDKELSRVLSYLPSTAAATPYRNEYRLASESRPTMREENRALVSQSLQRGAPTLGQVLGPSQAQVRAPGEVLDQDLRSGMINRILQKPASKARVPITRNDITVAKGIVRRFEEKGGNFSKLSEEEQLQAVELMYKERFPKAKLGKGRLYSALERARSFSDSKNKRSIMEMMLNAFIGNADANAG